MNSASQMRVRLAALSQLQVSLNWWCVKWVVRYDFCM